MVRVLIADDHKVVRDGLRAALKNVANVSVLNEVADGATLQNALEVNAQALNVILLDLKMPAFPDPVSFVSQTKARYPHIRIVVMTGHNDDSLINRMIQVGVDGYLLKTSTDDLEDVIQKVMRGEPYYSREAAQAALMRHHRPSETVLRLSQREQEVLELVAQGLTNDQIAEQLYLSPGTIRNYVTRLMEKCDVTNRTTLTARALQQGWIVRNSIPT